MRGGHENIQGLSSLKMAASGAGNTDVYANKHEDTD